MIPVDRLSDALPGLGLLVVVGAVAALVASAVPFLHPLIAAVAAGIILGNVVGVPDWARPGFALHGSLLNAGIVLLGATISFSELLALGGPILALVAGTVAAGILLGELIGRFVFRLTGPTPSLLAAGSSICGVSAVVAVGRAIHAKEQYLALAAATILLFDAITLLIFPVLGEALGLSSAQFGVWAGLGMFSTGPSVAAAVTHSPEAAQWATVTKLGRNAMIGLVVVGYAVAYSRRNRSTASTPSRLLWTLLRDFPLFVVGFVCVAVLANAGVLPEPATAAIPTVIDWLFVVAFVGLGSSMLLSSFRRTGLTPLFAVLTYLLVMGSLTLGAVLALV